MGERKKAIQSKEDLEKIKKELKKNGKGTTLKLRDYIMFEISTKTGLKLMKTSRLRISDVLNKDIIKDSIVVDEVEYYISDELKKELCKYILQRDIDEYLFKSREGDNKPLNRTQVWRIIRDAAEKAGVEDIGVLSTDKTFGKEWYNNGKDMLLLFAQKYPAQAKRVEQFLDYIGAVENDEKNKGDENDNL